MKRKILIGLGLVVLLILWSIVSIYPDWLWFKNLGFSPVFWTMLLSRYGFGGIIWFLLILVLFVNAYVAKRLSPPGGRRTLFAQSEGGLMPMGLSGNALNLLLVALILIVSFVMASKGSDQWDMVLRYFNQVPFGSEDPVFHNDIGFYVFTLPLLSYVRNGLLVVFLFAGLVTLVWYLKEGALQIEGDFAEAEGGLPTSVPKITIAPNVKRHLAFLAGIMILLMAVGYHLKAYELLYSTRGPVFGASYTDVHVRLLAYRVLTAVSAGMAVVLFVSAFRFNKRLLWLSGAVWVGSIVLLGTLVPLAVQQFVVKPNELAREKPYIKNNIEFTREAYNLNKIKEVPFDVNNRLRAEDIKKHNVTIQNIRVWDERPLLQTYRQIQSIRLYYDFNDVDVDRYRIGDQYRQVLLSARELVVGQLPPQANTWVNQHLIYTHGYGLAMSPVNEVTEEGLPRLLIKDLPPAYEVDLKVERPEIYYGERTEQYVLVKTKTNEFDYPKGDKNVYTVYEGKGGVPIGTFMRRLLFAVEFMDPQILFTTYLSPESRIMYNRRIERRVACIAPFLGFDGDPYLVVAGGKLYWIIDAYTTSDMYPYSRPSRIRMGGKGVNYIRNSVKVIIDAYHGDVTFYMVDGQDPLARTYRKIFPDLFKPFEAMPEDLKRHVRYPRDLFQIQAESYRSYHMRDPQVFYNQEDLWQMPDELYGDARQEMKPYYIIIKLPEGEKEEYLLMLPFTPSKKDNMIGWLAARSDLPHYGSLLVYKLPKDKLVYGPMQIEARVDQQPDISRELTLWGQRGSRVIRGNLVAIPISDSFIYVEPVYLEAKQTEEDRPQRAAQQPGLFGKPKGEGPLSASQRGKSETAALPELKRVIVAYGNQVIMEETLDRALGAIFGEGVSVARGIADQSKPPTTELGRLGAQALDHYTRAKGYLREGNWAAYGRELEAMEKVLGDIAGVKENTK